MEIINRRGKRKPRVYLSNEEQAEIIRLHLLESVSQASLARKYGVAQSTTSRLIRTFAASNDKSMLLMKNKPVDNKSEEIKALR